ncbi:MAG: hypothetical protein FWE35_22040 [Streptosporangiales bacterium]|jgi:hypothetical protein|nr:hypothetical protein [Streptosporangiales bacterium]
MATFVLIILLGLAGLYIERKIHPWRKCPSCGGSKKNAFSGDSRWGDCKRCGNDGKVRRWFA